MPIRLLTLDCANTLLRGHWDPVRFALEAARSTGLCLPRRATETYGALLRTHYPAILAANRTGDPEPVREAYVELVEAWLKGLNLDPKLAPEVVDEGARLLPGLYEPFADTIPFLVRAREEGLRLSVVSNWDVSLPRVLAAHGLDRLVDEVYASLVVGAEKPDPTMLRLAMASAGVRPDETIHVGDDPVDDLGAADNAGVTGLLIDRSNPLAHPPPFTLHGLMEVLDWIA